MFGALLTDLSQAFDCLDPELLIGKLNAYYGFSVPALKLIHDYLSNRKQRTKVNRTYSSWLEIVFGVPQGSIISPLLLNIFLADLFFILNDVDIASYADDNIPYAIVDDINSVITSLKKTSKALFEWFENDLLKSNADKCHLLVSSSDAVNSVHIGALKFRLYIKPRIQERGMECGEREWSISPSSFYGQLPDYSSTC